MKRFVLPFLALTLALTCAACGTSPDEQTETTVSTPAETETVSTSAPAETDVTEETEAVSTTPAETAEPEEMTVPAAENNYLISVPVGDSYQIDLDEDGSLDTVQYDVDPDTQDASGAWSMGMPNTFSVNGTSFLSDDAENPMSDYDIWMADAYNPDAYYLVDLDASDGYYEIALVDYGPSDDEVCYLFRYDSGSMSYLGWIPSCPEYDTITFYGDGTVQALCTMDVMQTWRGFRTYQLSEGTIAAVEGELFTPYSYDDAQEVYLKVALTVYAEPDLSADTLVLEPSEDALSFPLTDGESWVQIVCADGSTGWAYFTDYFMVQNGDEMVDDTEVFENLIFAG